MKNIQIDKYVVQQGKKGEVNRKTKKGRCDISAIKSGWLIYEAVF